MFSSLSFLCHYNTTKFCNCQQFFYDKNRQIITEINIPTMSPINAAPRIPLLFFIFTTLVYIAIVYRVVSVDPIIVDVINPTTLSTPYLVIISVPMAIEALPEIGLKIANGIISFGIPKLFKTGDIIFIKLSIIPELLKTPIATKSPISVGINPITIFIPSSAPSINKSNTLTFSFNATIIIIVITNGIIIFDIKLIKFIAYHLFTKNLTVIIADIAANTVATHTGNNIAVGLVEFREFLIAITVVGIICIDAVFRTIKIAISLLNTFLFLFLFCNDFIAFKPIGVAAFP